MRLHAIEAAFLKEAHHHYVYAWERLDGAEQTVLATLAQAGEHSLDAVRFQKLKRLALLAGSPQSPQLASGGWRRFISGLAGAQPVEQAATLKASPRAVILGRYELLERLGGGGMAEVYRGRHIPLDELVAIKIIRPELSADPEFRERFKREARLAYTLHHPHIVRSLDFGEEGGTYYIVMDLVEGGSLADCLWAVRQAGQAMPLAEAVRIAVQVGQALAYAHAQGVTHRDVKPANILLAALPGEECRAVLTDFGVARMVGSTSQTRTGALLGTPMYAAPEQLQASHAVDQRVDIYALGAVLYEMAAGRLPFEEWYHALTSPVPAPSTFRPDLPPALEAIILKALAKEPEARYQAAGDMLAELASV